jgi:nicotinamide-nucleotide amidase
MHAEIVMIGTELLLGEIVDTNANLLARALRDIGLDLYFKTTVGDNEARITEVLNNALDRSDVIITSGGIGPTVDDMTRQAVANATGRKLVYSTELEEQIAARFRSFGRTMAENNKRQAYIPEGALPLPNPVGTAPCYLAEDTRGRGFIISLPGVPRELEYMLNNTVIPILIERMGGRKVMKVRVLRTCAVGESNIDRGIGDLMTSKNPTVGTAAHAGQTDVRITAKADTEEEANALVAEMEAKLRERLGVAVYGVDKETVMEIVGRLLEKQGLKLAIIDTLTQGQLAREMKESGFSHLLATDLSLSGPAEAFTALGIAADSESDGKNGTDLAAELAAKIAAPNIIGVALLGPLSDETHEALTFVAVHGPGHLRISELGRSYADTDYVRRWLVIQGLDRIRRAVLGELTSPVDWN